MEVQVKILCGYKMQLLIIIQQLILDTDFDGDGECGHVLPSLSTGTSTCISLIIGI